MSYAAAGTPTGTDVSDWYFDFHIGGDSLDVAGDWALLNVAKQYLAEHKSKIRGVVLEENGGKHSLQRALGHARNSSNNTTYLKCVTRPVAHKRIKLAEVTAEMPVILSDGTAISHGIKIEPKKKKSMGEISYKILKKNFSNENFIKKYMTLFEEIL